MQLGMEENANSPNQPGGLLKSKALVKIFVKNNLSKKGGVVNWFQKVAKAGL